MVQILSMNQIIKALLLLNFVNLKKIINPAIQNIARLFIGYDLSIIPLNI